MSKKIKIKKLKRRIGKKAKKKRMIATKDLLSSGSTLLNLACSDRKEGAFYKGGIFQFAGDSDTGKSMVTMTIFAEAAKNVNFDEYQFIHDNAEGGALMDVEEFFGAKCAKRMALPPRGTSRTIEDFYFNLDDLYKTKEPFIYILDSMDGISSKADEKKLEEAKKADDADKEVTGSYGMAKAKANSEGLRRAKSRLAKTGSILIVVSQTRDAINARFAKKAISGGKAIKFYARLQLWASSHSVIKKTVNKIPHQIGINCTVNIKKNHVSGRRGAVEFPIFNAYGIDDIGSCVDFLIINRWKKSKQTINATDFGVQFTRDRLITHIEEEDLVDELVEITAEAWDEIQRECKPKRRKRYE